MSKPLEQPAHNYRKTAYFFINTVLVAPVVLLPIPALIFHNPMLLDILIDKWQMSMLILLVSVVAIDSVLLGINTSRLAMHSMLWIAGISLLLMNQSDAWSIALFFILHSFRSGFSLFKQPSPSIDSKYGWWNQMAWVRDIAVASCILIWLTILF